MAKPLPSPPKQNASEIEQQQWLERLFRRIKLLIPAVSTSTEDVVELTSQVSYHGVNNPSSSPLILLPLAETVEDGHMIIIQDEAGAAATRTITIGQSVSGTDTINGVLTGVTITTNYGRRTLIKNGAGKWFSA